MAEQPARQAHQAASTWDEVVWEPNVHYSAVELEGKAEALGKVAYTVLNPVSAGLIERSEAWPGLLSSLKTLHRGRMQVQRPKVWFKESLPLSLTLRLTPPPCFTNHGECRRAIGASMNRRLEALQQERVQRGRRVLGRRAVRNTAVTARPATRKERFGRRPTFSALTRQGWRQAVKRLRAFRATYRQAYEAWQSGAPDVEFPPGTWWFGA